MESSQETSIKQLKEYINKARLAANMCDDYTQYCKEMREVAKMEAALKALEKEKENE